ncbi:Protein of unknown function [Pyronema omphalodes CBS 100304]|uniref:Uncharacterized protein n=1 Tax=Pyronema omphalodes (strain CBS 100304) TaxID=1076935 RepID=U4LNV9_PYROM|nr:Protein of unknown function [Pyronema omphalodes CBS 100304]
MDDGSYPALRSVSYTMTLTQFANGYACFCISWVFFCLHHTCIQAGPAYDIF